MSVGDLVERAYYVATGRVPPDAVREILDRPGWLPAGGAVLDFGGGDGRLAAALVDARDCVITVADVSVEALARVPAHPRLRAVRLEGPRLPFADASFDLILAHYVLHHVHDLPVVLAELRRVLRPGGLLVAVELDPRGFVTRVFALLARLRRTHVDFSGPEALATRLAAVSLDVETIPLDPSHYLLVGRRPA